MFYDFSELSLRSCIAINFSLILMPLTFLSEVERIDFYRTNITIPFLESYLSDMPKLKHINLGKKFNNLYLIILVQLM